MRGRRWLRYVTIGVAVLILSGCRHESWMLHGDWSLGMRRERGCRGTCFSSIPGPASSPLGPMAGPPPEAFAVAPHAKFHPIPTRPVFAPKPMLAARPSLSIPASPERIEEELPPPQPDSRAAASQNRHPRLRR
jgi:hypothetical protein